MTKRLTFQCWNATCNKTYTLLRDIEEGNPQLSVACPYCRSEAVVDLAPYRSPVDTIFKSVTSAAAGAEDATFQLPEILPTTPKPE